MTGGKPKLKKSYRDLLAGAHEEADPLGIEVGYILQGKHPKLVLSYGEHEVLVPFASTPRVDMQREFGRRKVRHVAREWGLR